MSEIDLIEIEFEDLFFVEVLLYLESQGGFFDLPLEGLLRGEEHDLCQLLGQGACSLFQPAVKDVLGNCTGYGDVIDTLVFPEP